MQQLSRITPATAEVLAVLLTGGDRVWGLQIIKETERKAGTVYPILERLEAAGWIVGEWDADEDRRGPRRRYYRLTAEARPEAQKYVASFSAKSQVRLNGGLALGRMSWGVS